jgi:hypothetical protein
MNKDEKKYKFIIGLFINFVYDKKYIKYMI